MSISLPIIVRDVGKWRHYENHNPNLLLINSTNDVKDYSGVYSLAGADSKQKVSKLTISHKSPN